MARTKVKKENLDNEPKHKVGEPGEPAYQDGWVPYTTGEYTEYTHAKFWKDANGVVHIQGMIKNGTTGNSATVFTLPVGYRPKNRLLIASISGSALARVDIENDGRIIPNIASTSWLSLDSISFRAEQ